MAARSWVAPRSAHGRALRDGTMRSAWPSASSLGTSAVSSPDGGWKYLSTHLWTTDYADLPSDIEDKIWW